MLYFMTYLLNIKWNKMDWFIDDLIYCINELGVTKRGVTILIIDGSYDI